MDAPIRQRAPYRGECSIEGCERPPPRTGLVLASLAAMAPPRRPASVRAAHGTPSTSCGALMPYLDSLAGERTKLGNAELLANEPGPVYGGDLQQNSMSCGRRAGRPPASPGPRSPRGHAISADSVKFP